MELQDEKSYKYKIKNKIISLLVLNSLGGRNQCIIYCRPFKTTNTTITGCLAKAAKCGTKGYPLAGGDTVNFNGAYFFH